MDMIVLIWENIKQNLVTLFNCKVINQVQCLDKVLGYVSSLTAGRQVQCWQTVWCFKIRFFAKRQAVV